MNCTVHEAAKRLQASIPAPPGTVNTLVFSDSKGQFIRLMIEPGLFSQLEHLPHHYCGYRVVPEKRQPAHSAM